MLLKNAAQGYHTCPPMQKIGFMVLLAAVIAWAMTVGIGLIWAALAGFAMGVLLVLG